MIPEMSEEEYVTRIYTKVVQAMVTVDSDGTEVGGYVDPEGAQKALCLIAGVIAAQAQPDMTQKQVRATADWCRKVIVHAMQATLKGQPPLEKSGFRFDPVKRH